MNIALLILHVAFTLIAITVTAVNLYFIRELKKKETYAIIHRKDGNDKTLRINPNNKSFVYEEKLYLVPTKPLTSFKKNKKIILYHENKPRHIDVYSEAHTFTLPKESSEAFYSVTFSEALKILNRAKGGLLGGLDLKKALIIGGIIVVGIMLLRGG